MRTSSTHNVICGPRTFEGTDGMNDGFAERLRRAISHAGSIQKLGESAGVAPRTISGYLVGKGDPSRQRLVALADAAGVSVEWLATGRGDASAGRVQPFTSPSGVSQSADASDFAVVPHIDLNDFSGDQENEDPRESASIAIRRDLLHAIGLNETDVKMVTARGDSMAPTINDGDRIVVDSTARQLRNDGIYVLQVGEGLLLRRLQRDIHGGLWVITDAPRYEDEHLPDANAHALTIVGRPILCLTQSL